MNKQYTLTTASLFIGLFYLATAYAETERQLDSHQHGSANLDIVVDADKIYLSFESPAANLIGFEHEPKNDEQKSLIDTTVQHLKNSGNVLSIAESAVCNLVKSDAEWHLQSEHADEHKKDHDHDEGHSEGHDEHEEHAAHEHHEEHESEAVHSEFHAEYEIGCSNIEKVSEIEVILFSQFKNLEKIHVQASLPKTQTGMTMTSDNNILQISH